MSNRSFYTAMLSIMFCSAAFALQPTVRAGSISLNSGVKPATNTIAKTASTASPIQNTSSNSSASNSASRGSASSKFGAATVPVSKINAAANEYQLALDALRNEIDRLNNEQTDLRQRQLTRNDVTEVIATTDLPGTNSGLNNTLTEMRNTSSDLQESVQTIQTETRQFTEALDETMDAKLRQRDLIDANNNAKVTTNTIRELQDSLAPTALATSIAQSDAAVTTLSNAGLAKTADLSTAVDGIVNDLNAHFVTNDALDTQLTRANLASKLGDEYVKDTDLTQATLSAKLGNAYLTNDTLTKATITDKLGDEYVKDTDFAGKLASSGVATNESVTELASNVQGLSTNVQTLSGNLDTVSGNLNTLSGNVGTLSGNVQTLTTKVNGGVNDEGSMLHEIYTNETIRTALKGEKGDTGPAGAAGTQGEKGDKGDAGTSFAFRSTITNNNEREACTIATQGYAYYNSTDGNMYICGCMNNTCAYAAAHIRGEAGAAGVPGEPGQRGIDAKPVEQTYCEENLAIVQALYPSAGITSAADCATKFTNAQYSAIMGGAKAYCLSILQTSNSLNLDTGIGKKLADTFGKSKMQSLQSGTLEQKLALDGFSVNKEGTQTANFMTACEARYNEIMSPKSAEQTYCEAQAEGYPTGTTNLTVIRRLYNNNSITCDTFTAEQYAAITGGAKAFCSSLSTNFNTVDLDKDVGLKMVKVYAAKKNVSLDAAKNALNSKKTMTVEARLLDTDFSIVLECINNYNSIMAGEKGDTGETGAAGADGEDGKTFKPIFDSLTGKLTWSEDATYTGSEMKITKTDDELNSAIDSRAVVAIKDAIDPNATNLASAIQSKSVDAVKADLGVTSGTLSQAIEAKAEAKAQTVAQTAAANAINNSNTLLTVSDLENLISSGSLMVGDQMVALSLPCATNDINSLRAKFNDKTPPLSKPQTCSTSGDSDINGKN